MTADKSDDERFGFTQNWTEYSMRDLKPFLDTLDHASVKRVLEIGSFEGRSLLHWSRLFPNAEFVCIDAWEQTDEFTALGINVVNARKVFRRVEESITQYVRVIQEDSRLGLAEQCWSDMQFDFVYIDGSHYADDTLRDALNVAPFVSVGGHIVFDDYQWNKRPINKENPKLAIDVFPMVSRYEWSCVHRGYCVAYRREP